MNNPTIKRPRYSYIFKSLTLLQTMSFSRSIDFFIAPSQIETREMNSNNIRPN